MHEIEISRQPIELFKILKFEGLVASGGEAKRVISEGQVQVNGVQETRKRKKIVPDDVIGFLEQEYRVVMASSTDGPV
jgi:ribosome-associated protein